MAAQHGGHVVPDEVAERLRGLPGVSLVSLLGQLRGQLDVEAGLGGVRRDGVDASDGVAGHDP